MNINHTEKKWFVYLRKRQEGPFSYEEMKSQLASKKIGTGTFTWAEGMADWAPLYEAIPELGLLKLDIELLDKPPPLEYHSREIQTRSKSNRLYRALIFSIMLVVGTSIGLVQYSSNPDVQKFISFIERTTAPLLARLAGENSTLLKLVSVIPDLPDVSADHVDELRRASLTQYQAVDATLALVPTENSFNRTYYLATGLPDGTRFDVHVNGVSSTLLGSLSASTVIPVEVHNHFNLVEIDTPMPTGSYVISVVPAAGSPNRAQMLMTQTFFIGEKNADYEAALKAYHAKIRAQAAQEIVNLRKIAQTMEAMLVPQKKTSLSALNAANLALSADIATWSDPAFIKGAYYGPLFQVAVQVAQAVAQYNDIQSLIATKKGDSRSLEIKVGEAMSVAKGAVINLESKIDFAERIVGTGELPEREGL